MRIRRKARSADSDETDEPTPDAVDADNVLDEDSDEADEAEVTEADGAAASAMAVEGPYDADEPPSDDVERIDLGSLLVPPVAGRELRMQVDEKSGAVQSVVLAAQDGALELRAFAAPRHGDLWSEVRPDIAADMERRGGTATEREGRFGTELQCAVPAKTKEGKQGTQPSRIIGVNGPRWLLRATLLGRPALETEDASQWEDALAAIVVRRGDHAMPVGEALELVLPENARRLGPGSAPGRR